MSAVKDPNTNLEFYELSHPWEHNQPTMPGFEEPVMFRRVNHAQHGVMSQFFKTVLQTSTHINAPTHLVSGAEGVGQVDIEHFFGSALVLSIPKGKWELVTAVDLEAQNADIGEGDIVLINTGWHERYSDSQEYFGHSPGMDLSAAQWLVDRKVKLVGVDTPQVDHPLATSLAPHRNGPTMKRLANEYKTETGREALDDYPDWIPAHKFLLSSGIPTIENVGGDINAVNGKRVTVHAMPWKWTEGDASVIRLMAITDPSGSYRVEPGK